jgi:hypothetical protein
VLLAVATVAAAALAAGVDTALATNECRGLNPCVPVAGPWVVVPVSRGASRPQVQFQLACPRGYVVGGLDAELTDRGIDVAFLGKLGSPVNPGITTSRTVVVAATYVGESARAPSFRPHIGCTPAAGGGRRTPTAVSAVVPPGQPTVRRVRTVRLRPGAAQRVTVTCGAAEHLVGAYHARAFYTTKPPTAELIASLAATRSVRGDRVTVVARVDAALGPVRAVVQVAAVCAGGK